MPDFSSRCIDNNIDHDWDIYTAHHRHAPNHIELRCATCGLTQWYKLEPKGRSRFTKEPI